MGKNEVMEQEERKDDGSLQDEMTREVEGREDKLKKAMVVERAAGKKRSQEIGERRGEEKVLQEGEEEGRGEKRKKGEGRGGLGLGSGLWVPPYGRRQRAHLPRYDSVHQ